MALLGGQSCAAARREREHAQAFEAEPRSQRHADDPRIWDGLRAEAGEPCVLERPAGCVRLVNVERHIGPTHPSRREHPTRIRQEHRRTSAKGLGGVLGSDDGNLFVIESEPEASAQCVESRGSFLSRCGVGGLTTDAGRERARGKPHDEHHDESKQVTLIVHLQRVVRRHEEKIVGDDGECGGEHGRASDEKRRDDADDQKVQHHHVGSRQEVARAQTETRNRGDQTRAPHVVARANVAAPLRGRWRRHIPVSGSRSELRPRNAPGGR
jgi:hypothetical protein